MIAEEMPSYHKLIEPSTVGLDLVPERPFFVNLVLELPSAGSAPCGHVGRVKACFPTLPVTVSVRNGRACAIAAGKEERKWERWCGIVDGRALVALQLHLQGEGF